MRYANERGVETVVMEVFFDSRMPDFNPEVDRLRTFPSDSEKLYRVLEKAITEECDEMFLDPSLR